MINESGLSAPFKSVADCLPPEISRSPGWALYHANRLLQPSPRPATAQRKGGTVDDPARASKGSRQGCP